jgi:hypothetical protein
MRFVVLAFCTSLAACGSCSKSDDTPPAPVPSASVSSSANVVAEPLPRCRKGTERLPIPGEEVIVGDVAIGPTGLLAGVVRMSGGKRVASILKAPLALDSQVMTDVGTPLGDDPPPSPRWNGSTAWVAYFASHPVDAGAKLRELVVRKLGEDAKPISVIQQADESLAFDVAWSESNAGLVTWDEDGPPLPSDAGAGAKIPGLMRGIVKIQPLTPGSAPVTVSPPTSDADSPRLIAKAGGGFWLAWLAQKPEEEAQGIEGPGETRAFRWVEVIALDNAGVPDGNVRRLGSEKGRAVAFELARSGPDLAVMVQDEIAASDGGRILRHKLSDKGKPETGDIVKDGVGHTLADLVPAAAAGDSSHWLAWNDTNEHAHLTQLGPGLVASGKSTSEPSLEGARVLASSADTVFALAGVDPSSSSGAPTRTQPELLRFICP